MPGRCIFLVFALISNREKCLKAMSDKSFTSQICFYVMDIMGIIIWKTVDFALSYLSHVFHNVFSREIMNFTSFVLYL